MRHTATLVLFIACSVTAGAVEVGGGNCCAGEVCPEGQFCVSSASCWPDCCTSCCCEQPAELAFSVEEGACSPSCSETEVCLVKQDPPTCVPKLSVLPANPKIPHFGYGAIVPDSNPIIAGEVTSIDVRVGNDGSADAKGVEVQLSYYPWGVSFSAWYEIDTLLVDVSAQSEAILSFSHIFETQAHTCLEAKILDVAGGGNLFVNDDRGQINTEVVYSDDDASVDVPIMNGLEEDLVIDTVSVRCRKKKKKVKVDAVGQVHISSRLDNNGVDNDCDGTIDDDCNGYLLCDGEDDDCDGATDNTARWWVNQKMKEAQVAQSEDEIDRVCHGLDNDCDGIPDLEECPAALNLEAVVLDRDGNPGGPLEGLKLAAQSTLMMRVTANLSAVVGTVDVVAVARAGGETNHALVQLVHASPWVVLNAAQLCCLRSVRQRTFLEALLAAALEALAAADAPGLSRAVRLLRLFLRRAQDLGCELGKAEHSCVQRAVRRVLDVIRMLARRSVGAGKETHVVEGDELRRAGMADAAGVEYSRAFEAERISLALTDEASRFARTGRNPQTGKEIKIVAKNVPRFKAGADLSKAVN